jgi:hypothetical protein
MGPAGRDLDIPMNWTTSKPKVPGLYWYRKHQKEKGVLMHVHGTGEQTAASLDGQWESVFNMDGEWSGPVIRSPL